MKGQKIFNIHIAYFNQSIYDENIQMIINHIIFIVNRLISTQFCITHLSVLLLKIRNS